MRVVPLGSHTGGHSSVRPGGGWIGDLGRCGAEVTWHLLLLSWVVLFEPDVPGQAADGRHRLELVDYIPRDEVNVIVAELDADVTNTFSPQLV